MFTNNNAHHNGNWNSQKRIDLSRNLGQAYCLGLNIDRSDNKTDTWTSQKFIHLSRSLSSAYGVDF